MPDIENAPVLFKDQEEILNDLIANLQVRVPDVYVGEDSNIRLLFEVFAGGLESLFLANQILNEDVFVQSANAVALERHGAEFGFPRKTGTPSVGTLKIGGAGGTYIPIGATAGYDPGTGVDALLFEITADGTIPNPGIPTAPTTAAGAAGNISGLIEYAITFVTAAGETTHGSVSTALSVTSKHISLTAIPLGGTGTTKRRIYRQKDGGGYKFVAEIANNSTTTYDDNIADGSLLGPPPDVNTALAISLAAQSEEVGAQFNVTTGTITEVTEMPDGITDVTNAAPFSGGSDEEDYEVYRTRLLNALQAPQTGSAADMQAWAEEVNGVESATVIENDNLGTPTNGHVTVRITGPDGSVPAGSVITAVQDFLDSKDIANITIHVTTFTSQSTNVTVDVTTDPDFNLSDVTPSVESAIEQYILGLRAGETLYISGIVDAVYGLAGIVDVVVTTPGSNQSTAADHKRVPGTISVT